MTAGAREDEDHEQVLRLLINDVRSDAGLCDPLLVVARGPECPPTARGPEPSAPRSVLMSA